MATNSRTAKTAVTNGTAAKRTTTRRKAAATPAKAGSTTPTSKTPAKASAKAAAPAAPAAPKVKKSDQREEDRDWTYLADKPATELHEDFAVWLEEKTGIEVDLKTLQAVCVMRMVYQRSDANKNRSTYRGLDETVVDQRSKHMVQAHVDAREIRERQAAEAEAKQNAAKAKRAAAKAAKTAKTA